MLIDVYNDVKHKILLLIAPEINAIAMYNEVKSGINPDVIFCYSSWEKILECLKNITYDDEFRNLLVYDLRKLLERKGFDKFQNFKIDMQKISSNVYWEFKCGKTMRPQFDFYADIVQIIEEVYYEFK